MIKSWITWDGRKVGIDEMSHQHMSNIYYYTNFVLGKYYPQSIKSEIHMLLIRKFGAILPYHPDTRFKQERDYLLELGYLRDNGDIVINGSKVGTYGCHS